MAHGITLAMRAIKPPSPVYLYENPALVKTLYGYGQPKATASHTNPEKDRSLAGKARIRARRAVSA